METRSLIIQTESFLRMKGVPLRIMLKKKKLMLGEGGDTGIYVYV